MEIIHADVLVHPDYSLLRGRDPIINEEQVARRKAWIERAQEIATSADTVLFYFSAFVEYDPYANPRFNWIGEKGLLAEEQARIDMLVEMLGNKFFPYPGLFNPTEHDILQRFQKRDITFGPSNMTLLAYGEYFDRCVGIWGTHMRRVLDLPMNNLRLSSEMSLTSYNDVNRDKEDSITIKNLEAKYRAGKYSY